MTRHTLALLAVASLAPAAPVPKAVKKVDPFPFLVGTKWEYIVGGDPKRVDVDEVTAAEVKDGVTTFKVVTKSPGRGDTFETFRLDPEGRLTVVENSSGEFTPPRLMTKAGMKAGDEFVSKWVMKPANGKASEGEYLLSVGEAQEITTAAGKYQAVPVKRTFLPKDNNPDVHWYVDGVGLVRRTYGPKDEPILELKSFTPGKK